MVVKKVLEEMEMMMESFYCSLLKSRKRIEDGGARRKEDGISPRVLKGDGWPPPKMFSDPRGLAGLHCGKRAKGKGSSEMPTGSGNHDGNRRQASPKFAPCTIWRLQQDQERLRQKGYWATPSILRP